MKLDNIAFVVCLAVVLAVTPEVLHITKSVAEAMFKDFWCFRRF